MTGAASLTRSMSPSTSRCLSVFSNAAIEANASRGILQKWMYTQVIVSHAVSLEKGSSYAPQLNMKDSKPLWQALLRLYSSLHLLSLQPGSPLSQ